jgi:putative spermidine/putrescine transport system ATP-binding protein
MARLRLQALRKTYGATIAVHDVCLEVGHGEFVTLVGGSGCGKTTLLRMVAGFTRPEAGELYIDDVRVDALPPRARQIGFVFQSYALFPTMTVAGNIGFALRLRRRPRAEVAGRVRELCELTHLLGLEDRYPHELSGGQQQRVALARALAPRPSILLLDEPLSALDAKIRTALRAELRAVVQRLGTTTLLVTHDQEEALSISDRVAVMEAGRLIQVGTPIEIYFRPATSFVADFIGTSNRLTGGIEADGRLCLNGIRLPLPPGCLPVNGPHLLLCVRPEHIALMRPQEAPADALRGVLASFAFMGQTVRATVALANPPALLVDVPAERWLALHLSRGEPVACRLDPDRLLVFPGDVPAAVQP